MAADDPLSPDIDKKDTHQKGHKDKALVDVDIEPPPDSNAAPQIMRAKMMEAGEGDDATKYLSLRRLYRRADGSTQVKGTAGTLAFPSRMTGEQLADILQALADVYGIDVTIERDIEDWLSEDEDDN